MKYTNNTNVSLPLALWLANDTYAGSNNLRNKQISATSLLKPMKQLILSLYAPEMEADIISFLASRNGTAVHDAVEFTLKGDGYKKAALKLGYSQEDVDRMVVNPTPEQLASMTNPYPIYSEIRTEKNVLGWTVTGEFDLVVDGTVRDIKNTKTYSFVKKSNDTKYIQQGSIYRWLNPMIITKDVMYIDFIFSDWQQIKANTDPNYPKQPIVDKKFDLIPYQQTEFFVMNKIREIEDYLLIPKADVEDMLPQCTDEELWRSESEFKYYSKADAARATKAGFTSYMEAHQYMMAEKKGVGVIKEIKGEVKACNYCKAFPVCKQKDNYLLSGELISTKAI
jgi:hypothetical protein